MPIYYVFIINRAGGLIYDYSNAPKCVEIELRFESAIDFKMESIDSRPTVVLGERGGVGIGYTVVKINGKPLSELTDITGSSFASLMQFLGNEENYPLSLHFARPALSTNEKIILSSMFHSFYAIGVQLSPVAASSGIRVLETDTFRLHCFQTLTGMKFLSVSDVNTPNLDHFLQRIYEHYVDYALKNPFYSLDMPIRCELFDSNVIQTVERYEKFGVVSQ
ncbi:unnamed protein product [Soboliphyme baturini]|uniref:Trafficking protein particle complex subunit n=1 Tax=Soboliphyme baturini TaxID=241478 RepID=A0A183IB55_9BILA|nr:unnamed protein product [Soboliphyme baturini]